MEGGWKEGGRREEGGRGRKGGVPVETELGTVILLPTLYQLWHASEVMGEWAKPFWTFSLWASKATAVGWIEESPLSTVCWSWESRRQRQREGGRKDEKLPHLFNQPRDESSLSEYAEEQISARSSQRMGKARAKSKRTSIPLEYPQDPADPFGPNTIK